MALKFYMSKAYDMVEQILVSKVRERMGFLEH